MHPALPDPKPPSSLSPQSIQVRGEADELTARAEAAHEWTDREARAFQR